MAVGHRILTIAWHIIRDGAVYREAGGDYFDRLHPDRSARRLVRHLQQIGFDVLLTRTATKPECPKLACEKPEPSKQATPAKPPAADPKI